MSMEATRAAQFAVYFPEMRFWISDTYRTLYKDTPQILLGDVENTLPEYGTPI
jgi:hypothetical protein